MYTLTDRHGAVIAQFPDMEDLGSILDNVAAGTEQAEQILNKLQQIQDDGK